MSEIYWITRLDLISNWFTAAAVISGIILVVSFTVVLISDNISKVGEYESDREEARSILTVWNLTEINRLRFFCFSCLFQYLHLTQRMLC